MKTNSQLLSPVSRSLVAAIFISGGIDKLVRRERTAQYMASKNMPLIPFFQGAAALVEVLGGLSLLLGRKHRLGAGLLAAYLVPTTLIFHDFWRQEGEGRDMQLVEFMKNLAIIGGLVEVARNANEGRQARLGARTEPQPELIEIIEVDETERVA